MNTEDILPPRQHTSPPNPIFSSPNSIGEYYLEAQKGKTGEQLDEWVLSFESRQIIPHEIDVIWQHEEQM